MTRQPPRVTRTSTPFPYPTLFRSDRNRSVGRDMKAMVCSDPDQLLPLAEPPCLIGTEGKSRDVVQPCHHRQEYLFKRAALPDFLQPVQRNRPFQGRSEEHTSELQSLMRISYAVFCLKKKNHT